MLPQLNSKSTINENSSFLVFLIFTSRHDCIKNKLRIFPLKLKKLLNMKKVLLTRKRDAADINFRINSFMKMTLPLFSVIFVEPVDELSH